MVMTIEETTKVVDKIKIYRPSFGNQFDKVGLHNLKVEWFRVLEPYDYEDVDKKLDDFFKNGDNFGKYPDVYYLIKYLKKHDEKLKTGVNYVRCQLCNTPIDIQEYNEHYNRCSSVDYLFRMSNKYYNVKLNKEKMMKSPQKEFENYYWNFCEKVVEVLEDGLEKHVLTNAILTHYGKMPQFKLENISKDMI